MSDILTTTYPTPADLKDALLDALRQDYRIQGGERELATDISLHLSAILTAIGSPRDGFRPVRLRDGMTMELVIQHAIRVMCEDAAETARYMAASAASRIREMEAREAGEPVEARLSRLAAEAREVTRDAQLARDVRDHAIREALQGGMSVEVAAELTGMSRSAVSECR